MSDDNISRQAALRHLYGRLIESANNNIGYKGDIGIVFEEIAAERLKTWMYEVPAAQPEIVRCHKCVHWQRDTVRQNSNDAGWWNEAICEQHSRYGNETYEAWTMADWYCADAERRDDE